MLPICSDSFAASLERIATLINAQLQPPCISSPVAHKPGTDGFDCTVVSHTSNGLGGTIDATVPSCASNGGTAPCWRAHARRDVHRLRSADDRQRLDRSEPADVDAQNATVNCALCDPMHSPTRAAVLHT